MAGKTAGNGRSELYTELPLPVHINPCEARFHALGMEIAPTEVHSIDLAHRSALRMAGTSQHGLAIVGLGETGDRPRRAGGGSKSGDGEDHESNGFHGWFGLVEPHQKCRSSGVTPPSPNPLKKKSAPVAQRAQNSRLMCRIRPIITPWMSSSRAGMRSGNSGFSALRKGCVSLTR